jgi:ABC-type branched-subunit amino acid transport system permease subunit
MLKSNPQELYSAILACIIGSLFVIYSGFTLNREGAISISFALLCAAFTYWLSRKEI